MIMMPAAGCLRTPQSCSSAVCRTARLWRMAHISSAHVAKCTYAAFVPLSTKAHTAPGGLPLEASCGDCCKPLRDTNCNDLQHASPRHGSVPYWGVARRRVKGVCCLLVRYSIIQCLWAAVPTVLCAARFATFVSAQIERASGGCHADGHVVYRLLIVEMNFHELLKCRRICVEFPRMPQACCGILASRTRNCCNASTADASLPRRRHG